MNDNIALLIFISLIVITIIFFGGNPSIKDGIVDILIAHSKERVVN